MALSIAIPAVIALGVAVSQVIGPIPANQTAFTNPADYGDGFFDAAVLSDTLRAPGRKGYRRGIPKCARVRDMQDAGPLALASVAALHNGAYSKAPRAFARAMNASAMLALVDHDIERLAGDIALVVEHARAGAWMPDNEVSSTYWAAAEALAPMIPAWNVMRQSVAVTPADAAVVDAWLEAVQDRTLKNPNRHGQWTWVQANEMALAAMAGDRKRMIAAGEEGYVRQLGEMREDGSWPMETRRGRLALVKTSTNIASMVYAAEIAARYGVDLYARDVNGKTIHDAIRYLLAADADNALVDGYAKANMHMSGAWAAFAPMSQADPFAGSAGGWTLLYTRRFAGTPLAEALEDRAPKGNRVVSDAIGGWASCMAFEG